MKPFLLLSTRPEDDAAEGEREALVRMAGLTDDDLVQIRLDQTRAPDIDLDQYSGVFLGGGPFNASDAEKSELQQLVEVDLNRVVDEVVERDFPFLGLCYGVGALVGRLGGVVDRTYGEPVGAAVATQTDAGLADPLFEGVPRVFTAYVGHKEACSTLPPGATLLATGEASPVQAFRIGASVYATQFHPELDADGISSRIRIYRDAGYFPPEQTESLVNYVQQAQITPAVHRMLANFVSLAQSR